MAEAVFVTRGREVKGQRIDTTHDSITSQRRTAAELGGLIGHYQSVENKLHWCQYVSLREGGRQTAAGDVGANQGLVSRVAASLLK